MSIILVNTPDTPRSRVLSVRTFQASLADVEKLGGFLQDAWREAGPGALGFTGATEETIREISAPEFLRGRLTNPDVALYITEDAGRVVGFAATRRIDETALELSGLIVLQTATGKGVGTGLVRKAESVARQAGYRRLIVKTEADNQPAIQFYKKLGLRETGTEQEQVEGTKATVAILEKTI